MKKILFILLVSNIIILAIHLHLSAQNSQNYPKIEKDGSVLLNNEHGLNNSDLLKNSNQYNSSAWKDFCLKNGNWSATFNNLTHTPHSAIGEAIKIEAFGIINKKICRKPFF